MQFIVFGYAVPISRRIAAGPGDEMRDFGAGIIQDWRMNAVLSRESGPREFVKRFARFLATRAYEWRGNG